ncbi:MAG: T9SS C-terminal target domain-containing protein [Calditrichaeota bacterium]|nr:MAG: T9SS C-terminal target domain-containing protein [Calditrichota bacterium]
MLKHLIFLPTLLILFFSGEASYSQIHTVWTQSYSRTVNLERTEIHLIKFNDQFIQPKRVSDNYHLARHTMGEMLWKKKIGEYNTPQNSMVLSIPHGKLIIGYQKDRRSHFRVYLKKLNEQGQVIWSKGFATYNNKLPEGLLVSSWSLSFSTGGDEVYVLKMTTQKNPVKQHEKTSSRTFELNQNYPNPFNPSTTISFYLPKTSLVTLKIYNILGQRVVTLIDEIRNAGSHKILFDARHLANGYYFYRIKAGEFISTKKMILLK